ncbi:hypothetical protein ACOSQ3_021708 [Xanthoceras sorbifolium]
MTIWSCNMITEVVADNGGRTEDHDICFSKLKRLELSFLSRFTSFSSLNYTFNFPSLENLVVRDCPKMKIFTAGVVITPMLREIKMDWKRYCCEGDVNTTMQQIQENLRLSLFDLSSLTSFCSVNCTLNFPSLNYLDLSECPKMKLFSSGVSHTPMLQQINRGFNEYIWEGDLNTTIQRMYKELNPNSDCAGPSTQHLE